MEASFGSKSLGLWAQKCGLCLVYKQCEFELMISHCMKTFCEDWDLTQEILEIPEWFYLQISGPHLSIELSPDLFDDSWLGFAISADFSVHENPTAFLDNNGSEIDIELLCHFKINEQCKPFMFCVQKRSSSGRSILNCGICILYKKDLEQFENTIIRCLTSSFDDLDTIVEYLKDKRLRCANKCETSGSCSKVVPQPTRSRERTDDEEHNESDSSYVNSHQYPRTSSEQLDFDQDFKYITCENSQNAGRVGPISQVGPRGPGSRTKHPYLDKSDPSDCVSLQ
ncbi:hypothetical protein PanWU01x14_212700 [Parasponia andersonii]|uniref:C-JID domain-containing protein n=1 Tax=Parasponia andersonii TaxID=3476 RepID=A0A2P5BSR9_PARAD|nr:hypothetical protein PanWU01x14_212700 [Parasponia andersonii]